jgi:hypothetical protein
VSLFMSFSQIFVKLPLTSEAVTFRILLGAYSTQE